MVPPESPPLLVSSMESPYVAEVVLFVIEIELCEALATVITVAALLTSR